MDKDYKNFVERMNSFDMEFGTEDTDLRQNGNNLSVVDEVLQHYGVLGMQWGVRKDRPSISTKFKENIKNVRETRKLTSESNKRERSWKRIANSETTNEDLKAMVTRVKLENTLKGMAKKDEYIRRVDLSNEDLAKRIERLDLEKQMNKAFKDATDSQLEAGLKVAKAASEIGIGYAVGGPGGASAAAKAVSKKTIEEYALKKARQQLDQAFGVEVANSLVKNYEEVDKFITAYEQTLKSKQQAGASVPPEKKD